MARAVVVGGGIGGMATALFAARRGHEVTVVDRDPPPPVGTVDDIAAWDRPGVAQAGHSHYFLARSTRVLREEAPDVLDAMAAVGIAPSEVRFGDGMDDDRALTARRPVWEAVLREVVGREPGVTLVAGSARGLVTDPGDPARVRGVQVRSVDGQEEEVVTGDMVVDAGGRRSASPRWLAAAGLSPPLVEDHPCELHYLCQHFRLREGEEPVSTVVPMVQPLPYAILLVFLGDNRTFSVAVALSAHDPLRRHLQDPATLQRVLEAVPVAREWLERADPIGDVQVMAGLSNRRRLTADDRPPPAGLVMVGDSALYTNPAMGQGVSLSCWMAQQVAHGLDRAGDDPAAVTAAHEAWVERELVPGWRSQVAGDDARTRQFRAGVEGAGFLPPVDRAAARDLAGMVLAAEDETFLQLVRRVNHLLAPASTLERPEITARLDALVDDGLPSGPPGGVALSRADFEGVVETA